jgi:hypothetical protein
MREHNEEHEQSESYEVWKFLHHTLILTTQEALDNQGDKMTLVKLHHNQPKTGMVVIWI